MTEASFIQSYDRKHHDEKNLVSYSLRSVLRSSLFGRFTANSRIIKFLERYLLSANKLVSPPVPSYFRWDWRIGYIVRQNIAFEYRYAKGKRDRLAELGANFCVSRLISSWYQEGSR